MLAVTRTAALSGIEGISVKVEVDSGPGLPSFNVIGLGEFLPEVMTGTRL